MKQDRGPDPTSSTVHLLWGRAAGRCQFEGCNKILSEDDITGRQYNKSVVAHIVASSPKGPRGDPIRSHQLSQNIDNLMLLCPEHHHLIDLPESISDFTEAMLLKMKRTHEAAIRAAAESVGYPETLVVRMMAAPHGRTEATVEKTAVALAVLADHRRPLFDSDVYIHLQERSEYGTPDYWNRSVQQLERQFTQKIENRLEENPSLHFSVFALAPIPLLVKLGHLMGDKMHPSVYQPFRMPNDTTSWSWKQLSEENEFQFDCGKPSSGNRVALALSLTAEVKEKDIHDAYHPDWLFVIRAARQGVNCIQSKNDLRAFMSVYISAVDRIASLVPGAGEIAVFPIVPASAAFSIGCGYMNDVWPSLLFFDNHSGFRPALTIGGKTNERNS